jgi:CSLREA domain-containing protein
MWKKLSKIMPQARGTPKEVSGRGRPGPRRFRPGLESLEGRAVPATFTVTTTLDTVAADGKLSLREAINAANAHPGVDTIVLPAGVYRLSLTGADDTNASGDLDVHDSTLFRGAGVGATVIDGRRIDRVFDVLGSAPHSIQVTFEGLTVRNGLIDAGSGGGIRVGNADLLLQDCAITGNRTSRLGGGISNAALPGTGNVTLIRSIIDRNVAVEGGGVFVLGDGENRGSVLNVSDSIIRRNIAGSGGGILASTVNLTRSTVSGNSASQNGGGIVAVSTATLTHSAVSGNSAGQDGGGIAAERITLTDSTVAGNTAGRFAGGIATGTDGTVTLAGSTVSGNHAGRDGGGIDAGTVNLTNSAVSGNSAGGDGGGISAFTATLTSSAVSGNSASGVGGGIDAGTATLSRSAVIGNFASFGGGIFAPAAAMLTGSTVSGNHATAGPGGGIDTTTATLIGSTVSGNSATGAGGGIDAMTATLTNSTVSGNSAGGNGGGIIAGSVNGGGLTLLNVTVTENSAHAGGGVVLDAHGTSSVKNSIIAGNLVDLTGAGRDVSGAFTSGGHNLIGDGTGATGFANGTNGDLVGTAADPIDPRLGPLANNGGPTRTHALLAGSPAIDHGDGTGAPATDQRGVARARDGDGNGSQIVDIGAFER